MTEREMKQRKAAARKARQRKARNRRVLTTVALMLVVCIASIGGTIAWLTDETESVVNTFSPSDIEIWMTETVNGELKSTKDGKEIENESFKIIPGNTEGKDPVVWVGKGSEKCYVFLQVTQEGYVPGDNTFADYINYQVDENNWTPVTVSGVGVPGAYYCICTPQTDKDTGIKVLDGQSVSYPVSVTKEMLNALQPNESAKPLMLSFKAAAVQFENLTLEEAIEQVKSFLGGQ